MPKNTLPLDDGENRTPAIIGVLPKLPASGAIKNLEEKLVSSRDFGKAEATALARAVTDPTDFRNAMERPIHRRVRGGTLLEVHTRLWTHAVIPMPSNTRLSEGLTFPFAGDNGVPPLPPALAAPDGKPTRVMSVADADTVAHALDHESGVLLGSNNLTESISSEGVREPLFVSVLTFRHSDGTQPVSAPVADDGSSRTTSCLDILEVAPADALYQLAQNTRALRGAISAVLQLLERDEESLTEKEYATLAAVTVPAFVVVGFVPDVGSDMDIARAISYRVGATHVDPPLKWGDGSKLDSQLSAALEECVRAGKATSLEAAYYSGLLSPVEALRAGFSPHADHRAAQLLYFFERQWNAQAINRGLRGLLGAMSVLNIPKDVRLEIASEAALRAYRGTVPEDEVATARRGLRPVFSMPEYKETAGWEPDVESSPEDLRDGALAELAADGPGRLAQELAFQGAFWLLRWNCIKPTRGGYHDDKRGVPGVLRDMWETPHGVQQLYRAVIDGRAGRPVRYVRADGKLAKQANGGEIALTDKVVREQGWPPEKPGEQPKPAATSGQSPAGALNDRRKELRGAVDELVRVVESLREPLDVGTGRPLVELKGLPVAYTDELLSRLHKTTSQLAGYRYVADQLNHVGEAEAS